jgi:hypothetical protein
MKPQEHQAQESAETLDRRAQERQAAEAQVTILVETSDFGGRTKNLSQAGVFFFSPDRLRVTVRIEDEHGRRAASGTLVRVERLDATTTGYAIEFDDQ